MPRHSLPSSLRPSSGVLRDLSLANPQNDTEFLRVWSVEFGVWS